jgi:putative endonuclease
MAQNHQIGKKGEELAANFLRSKGLKILFMNWTHKHLEVDIIALDKNILVLTEVKTRSDYNFGLPEEAVTRQKEKNLIQAAEAFLSIHQLDYEVRFDIISIKFNSQNVEIRHIPDAFNGWG